MHFSIHCTSQTVFEIANNIVLRQEPRYTTCLRLKDHRLKDHTLFGRNIKDQVHLDVSTHGLCTAWLITTTTVASLQMLDRPNEKT